MLLLQFRDAVGMIRMMVRDQDVGEAPAFLGQSRFDRRCLGRVDGSRGPGRGIMQKDAVVVFEAGEQVGFGWHNWLATPAWRRQASTPFPKLNVGNRPAVHLNVRRGILFPFWTQER